MSAPLVSVCMPVRNGERWLGEAIESILAQTHRDFELCVQDDASSDQTPSILREYAERDERVLVERSSSALGVTAALVRLCARARGTYIARMDADDIAFADRLERQVAVLERDGSTAVVGGAYVVLRADGSRGRIVHYPTDDAKLRRALDHYNCIAHPTATFRRDVYEEVGGYRLRSGGVEEYDLWLRMSEQHRIANVREPVLYRREHQGQVSHQLLEEQVGAMLAVVAAARSRRGGAPDPLAGMEGPDAGGVPEDELRAALVDAYASRIAALDDESLLGRAADVLDSAELRRVRVAVALRRGGPARAAAVARHPVAAARELLRARRLGRF